MTQTTVKKSEVIRNNPDFKKLINAVISRVGMDSIEDINSHGIDGGFNGFVYYSDTHAFAITHRKDIVRLLEQTAEELGEDTVKMVSGFGVFRNLPMDTEERRNLYMYLSGGKPVQGAITNVMAWFAAETVCRMFEQ